MEEAQISTRKSLSANQREELDRQQEKFNKAIEGLKQEHEERIAKKESDISQLRKEQR